MESDIIKALREVGKAIQADERYNTLLEKRKVADEDQRVKAIQEQMADLQIKHDEEAMKSNPNQVLMEECQKQYQDLFEKAYQIDTMVDYMDASEAVDGMMNEVMQYIYLFMRGEDPETCKPTPEIIQEMQSQIMGM